MGVLTALYEVDSKLFNKLDNKDQLPTLVDVINGWKKPTKIGLPKKHKFKSLYQDKGWDDIRYLLPMLGSVANKYSYQHASYMNSIEHETEYSCYYEPEAILIVLGGYRKIIQDVCKTNDIEYNFNDIKVEYDYSLDMTVISREDLSKTNQLLKAVLKEKCKGNKKFTDYEGDPFWEMTAEYVLMHYHGLIQMMTESMYEKNKNGEIAFKYNFLLFTQS